MDYFFNTETLESIWELPTDIKVTVIDKTLGIAQRDVISDSLTEDTVIRDVATKDVMDAKE
jgi:hypothetical protein